jgi:hypothetical protein
MKTISVKLTDNEITVDLTIRPATLGDSLRREMLAALALDRSLPDPVEQTAAVIFYPRCLAVTSGSVTWPGHTRGEVPAEILEARDLAPDEFVNLPEAISDAWWKAVIETNPRWALKQDQAPEQAEQDQKKG